MTPPIGILGGTFDPVHIGHLAVAEEAREALGLAKVLFVPAGIPPHKIGRSISAAAHRVTMVERAITGNDAFEVSRLEVDRPGPSYTLDTVAQILDAHPDAEVVVILSVEALRGLPAWHEPERLLRVARFAAVPRDGFAPPDAAWVGEQFPGAQDRVTFLGGPRLRLSATEIRGRVAAGRSIRYLVPDAVIAYIGEHGLYGPVTMEDMPGR